MLIHTVLLKPKKEVSQTEITKALEHVRTLQQLIPGIVNIQAGENLNSSNNRGYTYGFTMQFTDTEVFKGYAPHPAHQPVSEELQQLCERIIDFDVAEG